MQIAELNTEVEKLRDFRDQKDIQEELVAGLRAEFEESIADKVDVLKKMKDKVAEVQDRILVAMREDDLKSWKHSNLTISRKYSPTRYEITDEDKVKDQLTEMHLFNEYVETKEVFKPEIKTLFSQKDFEGVEKIEKDFISVLKAKTDDK